MTAVAQMSIDFDAPPPSRPLPETLARWVEFHHDNPGVWSLFKHFSVKAKEEYGAAKCSARLIAEQIRWQALIETKSEDGYKLNNIYIPYYSRLLMLTDLRFDGFFSRRDKSFDATDKQVVKYGLQDGDPCQSCHGGPLIRQGTELLICFLCKHTHESARPLT